MRRRGEKDSIIAQEKRNLRLGGKISRQIKLPPEGSRGKDSVHEALSGLRCQLDKSAIIPSHPQDAFNLGEDNLLLSFLFLGGESLKLNRGSLENSLLGQIKRCKGGGGSRAENAGPIKASVRGVQIFILQMTKKIAGGRSGSGWKTMSCVRSRTKK